MADDILAQLGFEQAGHGLFDLVDQFVNDGVKFDLHALALGRSGRAVLRLDPETDDNGVGSGGEENVRLADRSDRGMDDLEVDLLRLDIAQRLHQGLEGSLHIGLEHDAQGLALVGRKIVEKTFQRGALRGGQLFLTLLFLTLLAQSARRALGIHSHQLVARFGQAVEAEDFDRHAGTDFFDRFAEVVDEGFDFAPLQTAEERLTDLERAHFDDNGRRRTATRLHLGFDDRGAGGNFGTGFEFQDFGLQGHHLEQVVDAGAFGRGDRTDDRRSAPVLGRKIVFLKLLLHPVDVGGGQIGLVHRHDDRHPRRFGMADRFFGLRHDAVIRGDNEHDDIRDVRAARAHGGEGGVARGVEEGDFVSAMLDRIRTDVLGDAARFPRGDAGFADKIHERSFAVVDVAHESDDGRTGFEFLFGDLDFGFGGRGDDRFRLVHPGTGLAFFFLENKTMFLADDRSNSGIDRLVQVGEDVRLHQILDDHERLEAEGRGEVFDHDRRLDIDHFFAVLVDFEFGGCCGLRRGGDRRHFGDRFFLRHLVDE